MLILFMFILLSDRWLIMSFNVISSSIAIFMRMIKYELIITIVIIIIDKTLIFLYDYLSLLLPYHYIL